MRGADLAPLWVSFQPDPTFHEQVQPTPAGSNKLQEITPLFEAPLQKNQPCFKVVLDVR
jgi:hypothetical protein